MRKDIEKKITEVYKLNLKLEEKTKELEALVQDVCDFESYIEIFPADGIRVGNADSCNVAHYAILKGKTKKNKLSVEEHYKYST